MSSLQSAMTIIMAEVSIILIIFMSYLAFRYLRNNRDIMSAIRKLASKIRCGKDDRQSMLHDFLVQTCHYDDETATTAASALIEKERLFYTVLMETYLTRDHDSLVNLDNKTEEVIGAYRDLLTVSVKAINEEAQLDIETRTKQLSKTINDLNDKNKTLSGEIRQLKHEMDVTVHEYSSAFRNQQKSTGPQTGNGQETATTDDAVGQTDTTQETPDTTATNNESTPAPETDESNNNTVDAEVTASDSNTASNVSGPDETDDSIEPEFHNSGFDDDIDAEEPEEPVEPAAVELAEEAANDTPAALDDEINADLEALAAQLDSEEDTNPSIPLDGLDEDEDTSNQQSKAG